MWSIALTFLKSNWKATLGGGLALLFVVAVIGYIVALRIERSTLTSQITKLTATNVGLEHDKQTLQSNVKTLTDAIGTTNAAIEKLSASAAQTQHNFTTLNTTIHTETSNLAAKLDKQQQEQKPQTCDASIKYLVDAVPEYQQ